MRYRALSVGFSLLLLLAGSSPAQVVRTWVSTEGSDANPCSRQLPCRNFAAAVTAVDAGGEVVALDSGGYGAVSISKSVTIVAPAGLHAAIAPTTGTAINIVADRVTIRNVYLNGRGASTGVLILGANSTTLESVTINGFTGSGIGIQADEVFVENCVVRYNGSGLTAGDPFAPVRVYINNSRFENNAGNGVLAGNNSTMTVRDTRAASNGNAGFQATAFGTGTSRMSLMACQSARNLFGVSVDGDTAFETNIRVLIAYSAVVYNTFGLHESDGNIDSLGNNMVEDNGTDTVGVISTFNGT